MRNNSRSGLIKSLAFAIALIGAMMFGAPQGAQAAPAIVSAEVAGPAAGLTEVQYGGGHWRHHGGHRFRHRHHGHHFGHHHHRRHYGHRFGHHRHHHHGHRRYRY